MLAKRGKLLYENHCIPFLVLTNQHAWLQNSAQVIRRVSHNSSIKSYRIPSKNKVLLENKRKLNLAT